MTISTTTAKSRYAGDGSTTAFPTGFKFLDSDHVRVVLRGADGSETLWSEGSEYSLTGAGAPGGGTVQVITSPTDHTPAVGEVLVVKLAVPPRQETSLPLGGAFPSTAVEGMADLAALRDQQIEEALSRAVKFKETTALAEVAFPEPAAGKPVGWNADGDALVNLEAIGRWRGDWTPATGYVALDVIREPISKNIYVCETAHTAGSFAMDLAADKWSLAIDVADAEAAVAAAEAAQAAAETAQAAAATSESNAATSASAAAASAAAAATSATDAGNSATAASVSEANAAAAETAAAASEAAAAMSATIAASSASAAAASAAQVEDAKLIWQGDWSAGTYAVNDAVAHLGGSWIATAATAEEPGPLAADWNLLADKGDQGNDGIDGLGVPPGGTTGQVLRKASNADNDTLWGNPAAAPVDSVFGRTGAVTAQGGDYTASLVTNTPAGGIAATTVQAALNELDGEKLAASHAGTGGSAHANVVASGAAGFMTGSDKAKLDGIASGAQVNPGAPSQAQAEDGSSSTIYGWSPQRVHQAAKDAVPWSLIVAIGNETTALTTGTAKVTFRMPHAVTLTAVRASLTTVSSSGVPTFDINENGATVLSTKLSIDANEKTSTTAATAAVISDASLADDAEITIDVDVAGTGAAGAKITLIGYKTTT